VRVPQKPLSSEETRVLVTLLEESDASSLEFARGVFAAVATAPTEISPTEWFPLLLGAQVESPLLLKRLLALLMREYNACSDCLALSVPAVPSPESEAAIVQFAKGYVQVAQKDVAWTTDPTAFELTAPLMMLSGYAPAEAMSKIDPLIGTDLPRYLECHRETLPDDVLALFEHFRAARTKHKLATAPSAEKIGRNDPCPCGSGKKFKKCCAA
jgi:uncharacterized protein